ncbi:MAG: antibiotic biosynthesis monooxygenase [Bacteroidetes bacterium]|nr:antibiotic biosynthesis monooxygenase [Bacteroidota bacterium]
MLVRFVTMRFRPEAVGHFRQVFAESKDKIAAMPGCLGVQLLPDEEEPHCFYTWSEWTDADALDAYRHSELFAATWARTKPLFRAKPTAVSWYRFPVQAG